MKKDIRIVDQGRGPQLSSTRVTVQDLVPYFQENCSVEEIIRWIPSLTREEIAVVERFYRENKDELDEEDRRIRIASAENRNPGWVEEIIKNARAERLATLKRLHKERNGEGK